MSTLYQIPTGVGASKSVVEDFAQRVAEIYDYKPGQSLEELVAHHGGKIVIGSSGDEDHDSGSIVARNLNDYTIYLSPNTSRLRDRFTIAHELGHLLLHLPKIKKACPSAVMRATRWVDMGDSDQRRAELEANWFAAAFLMPAEAFSEVYSSAGVDGAKEVFDVSRSAADTRARALGL
ncbi:ImmA/IrrE family metallo-endopeptidase [Sphingobium sp. BYY-5]|uniref:ImmA/IrrE family metallo-endopeptidase n=1 Tax=Sphingobium sp. BYY-5 TaxID=2926400 RepID=UPI001FA72EE1|nr:ImmA/IrrE family metallo-endopeptidase [Sphingobium sp. BYY-5]MCI4588613.1 ImmA/IrrE family metallo-endopeptidase [Sphingobium sp. BYY-5]